MLSLIKQQNTKKIKDDCIISIWDFVFPFAYRKNTQGFEGFFLLIFLQ